MLLYTAVLGLLAMGIWLLAWRGTHDAIRTERFTVARTIRSESVLQAAALGIDLLRTGRPPSDPYECQVTVTGVTQSYDCAVVFATAGDQDTWDVQSWVMDDDDPALPAMPTSF